MSLGANSKYYFTYCNVKDLSPMADEKDLGVDLVLSSCEVELSQTPCHNGVCSQASVHYSAVTDIWKDGDRSTEIHIKPIISTNFLWNGYTPQSVQVGQLRLYVH